MVVVVLGAPVVVGDAVPASVVVAAAVADDVVVPDTVLSAHGMLQLCFLVTFDVFTVIINSSAVFFL